MRRCEEDYYRILLFHFRRNLKVGDRVKLGGYYNYGYSNKVELSYLMTIGIDLFSTERTIIREGHKRFVFGKVPGDTYIDAISAIYSFVFPLEFTQEEIIKVYPKSKIYFDFLEENKNAR